MEGNGPFSEILVQRIIPSSLSHLLIHHFSLKTVSLWQPGYSHWTIVITIDQPDKDNSILDVHQFKPFF